MAFEDVEKELRYVPDISDLETAPLRDIITSLYLQVLQAQVLEVELKKDIKDLKEDIKLLKDTLSQIVFFRTKWIPISYEKRTSEMILARKYRIAFENTIEAELLETMFFSKSGKPKSTKWQISEVAKKYDKRVNTNLDTKLKVQKVLYRIRDRLRKESGAELIKVSPTEFFWYNPY